MNSPHKWPVTRKLFPFDDVIMGPGDACRHQWNDLPQWEHYTVRCHYNAVNFLQNSHNRHPIARPWGRGMGCLLCVWSIVYVLLLSSQRRMKYRDNLDWIITALDWTVTLSLMGWPHTRNDGFILRCQFSHGVGCHQCGHPVRAGSVDQYHYVCNVHCLFSAKPLPHQCCLVIWIKKKYHGFIMF